ncbi:protein giant-lens [Periplaneta americana]|uniref:protein giant-lens n=1 Tax=Periplaneta americana TaxID=6978 RepID=UPI0037E9A4EE
MTVRNSAVIFLGIAAAITSVAKASRLPLVVFQYHHHHLHDHQDVQLEESTAPSADVHHSVHFHHFNDDRGIRVLYQVGNSEEELPDCSPWAVCSKVDLYDAPWVERQCRCPGRAPCSSQLDATDGHTITDKTRQFKLCEPVKKLPKCRYFRDITWTLVSGAGNATEQTLRCHCPRGAVAYLVKRQALHGLLAYRYSFACSPQSRLRCQRKEPCRLFTVRKRQELLDEVNTNTLCQCPHGHTCPRHHTDAGVIAGKSYTEEAIKTYSGYCVS